MNGNTAKMDIEKITDLHLGAWHALEYVEHAIRQLSDEDRFEDRLEFERIRDSLQAMVDMYGEEMEQWEAGE